LAEASKISVLLMVPEPLFGYIRSLIFSDVVDNIFALLQAYLHQMVTFYTK